MIAATGAAVEIMTPDRSFAPEVMAMNLVPYMRSLQKQDVTFTVTFRLESVQREAGGLLALVGSDYGGVRKQRRVDQVVVNHGTRPLDTCMSNSSRCRATWGSSITRHCWQDSCRQGLQRGLSSCFASVMPYPRATPMPRSTTRCAWSRTCKTGVGRLTTRCSWRRRSSPHGAATRAGPLDASAILRRWTSRHCCSCLVAAWWPAA